MSDVPVFENTEHVNLAAMLLDTAKADIAAYATHGAGAQYLIKTNEAPLTFDEKDRLNNAVLAIEFSVNRMLAVIRQMLEIEALGEEIDP